MSLKCKLGWHDWRVIGELNKKGKLINFLYNCRRCGIPKQPVSDKDMAKWFLKEFKQEQDIQAMYDLVHRETQLFELLSRVSNIKKPKKRRKK